MPAPVGTEADPHIGVDVPVNAVGAGLLLPSHVEHHHTLDLRRGLVVFVVRERPELIADELGRPVALLAGLAGRPQIVHWSCDRAVRYRSKLTEIDLPCPRELGLDEPVRAGADVAIHAADAGVRRALVGRELRSHHAVAGLAAELRGLHHLDTLERRDGKDHQH